MQLRDAADEQQHNAQDARVDVETSGGRLSAAAAASGIWHTMRWLLGEHHDGPISGETYEYPYTVREVGREHTRALDAVEGNAWHDVDADYAAGVRHAIGWAFWDHKSRPIPET